MSEHAVIVEFNYGSTNLDALFKPEDQLEEAIHSGNVGELDGNEMTADGSTGTLYMYGPDADKLFAVVKPVLETAPFMKGAEVHLRYGPPEEGVRKAKVRMGS